MTAKLPVQNDQNDPGAIRGVVDKIVHAIGQEDDLCANTNVDLKLAQQLKAQARDEAILAVLNDTLTEDERHSPYSMEDAREFVRGIRGEIQKYAKHIAGKEKMIIYSPKVIRVAMSLWLRSPAAYDELRDSGWIIHLPSRRTLEQVRHDTKVNEGQSILLYNRFRGNFGLRSEEKNGHISCDEMKFDENVMWHTSTHEASGFSGDFMDLDSVVRGVLSGQNEKEPAVQVNLWKYRSTDNTTLDCEFFYSGGNLNNADIRKQFLHVVTCLELINCRVFGFSSDGNSVNVTAMKMLSESASGIPEDMEWLDEHYISMVHPLDPTRRIYFWLCTTHQIKSMRNQLWTSREKGKRNFHSADDCPFGWDGLWEQYNRDQFRGAKNSLLVKAALLLDGWAKMNVHYAKVPFASQTLDDALQHICSEAEFPVPVSEASMYENDFNCYRPALIHGSGPLLGIQSARLAKVKAAIIAKKGELGNRFTAVMSRVALLEYQTVIHDIFNEVLMNKDLHLTKRNIAGFKAYLKLRMRYFRRWLEAMVQRPDKKARLTFLSMQTWTNLRFAVCGFIGYAEYILTTSNDESLFVPTLYSNTSFLEATFSHVRSLGGRDAGTFATRIASRSVRAAFRAIDGSSSYSRNEHLDEEEDNDGRFEGGILKELNKETSEQKHLWVNTFSGKVAATVKILPADDTLDARLTARSLKA